MEIFVVRHGIAEPISAACPKDADRPLSRTGKKALRRQVRYWKKMGLCADVGYCSPLLRARQTAELLRLGGFFRGPKTVVPDLAPGTDPDQLTDFLSTLSFKRVALVGHNPLVTRFCQRALSASSLFELAPGALVHLRWKGVHQSPMAELLGFIPPYVIP